MTVAAGSRLGAYEIGELAGRGGMGEVYRARDTVLKRTVAIKILPAAVAADADRLRRFQMEAETLAALNHPNISAIHALDEANGVRFLVLEFVEGETLADRLRAGPIAEPELLPIARQICAALAAAHDRGIVHRDLKPANIKIAPDGGVKLLDFGLARVLAPPEIDHDLSHSPTVTSAGHGVIAGTAAYMSPEQARGKPIDKRADMWALGCVLYEMLSGRPAFAGDTVTDILAAVLTTEPPAAPVGHASPQLRWLVDRCLQKDPATRFRDAADAAALLTLPVDAAPPRRARVGALAAIGAGAMLALAGAAAAWFWGRAPARGAVVRFDIPVSDAPVNQDIAISADGRRVAYVVADRGGRVSLWQRPLDALEAKPIEGTSSALTYMAPTWSPDGQSLAFVADGKLKRIDVRGGSPEVVAALDSQIGGIAWGRDDVVLFASNDHGLRKVSASGGSITDVTTRDTSLAETFHDCPRFLPDGRHFIYLAYSETRPENRAVYAASLDSPGTRTRIMTSDACVAYAAPGYLLFPRGSKLMARPFDASALRLSGDAVTVADNVATHSSGELAVFAVADSGTLVYRASTLPDGARSLVWIDRAGRVSDPFGPSLQPGVGPSIAVSPNGRSLAFATRTDQAADDIWVYDLERNVRLRLTTDPNVDHIPVWSPDSTRIAFDSHRGGQGSALFEVPANGAVPARPLLTLAGRDFIAASDWSRDGRFLIFHRSPTGTSPWSTWVLPFAGDRTPFAYRPAGADEIGARLSPNGRWLAYATNESGSYQVVVQPFPDPAGGKWQVSADGGAHPVWRRDGRELFYLGPSGEVIAVSVTTEPSFVVGQATTLFRTRADVVPQGNPFDAAPDGSKFVFLVPARQAPPPITTVMNWWTALKND